MKVEAKALTNKEVLAALGEVTSLEDPGAIAGDANLLELGHIDSTQFMDLVSILEDWTGVEVDFLEHDPAEMTTINGLLATFHAQ